MGVQIRMDVEATLVEFIGNFLNGGGCGEKRRYFRV